MASLDLVTVDGDHKLERGTADAYSALLSAARADGITAPSLGIVSGYRTTEAQAGLWQEALAKYGTAEEARLHIAPPGHSDHEKGIAIDFSGPTAGTFLRASDAAWPWLHDNAARFGFVPYSVEDWHWAHKGESVIPTKPGIGPSVQQVATSTVGLGLAVLALYLLYRG